MSHVTCHQFLIVRSFFFFVLLVIVALTEFHPIAVIVFLFACAYFLVSPLSSSFLPVTFVLIVALSLKVLSQADHDMLRKKTLKERPTKNKSNREKRRRQ